MALQVSILVLPIDIITMHGLVMHEIWIVRYMDVHTHDMSVLTEPWAWVFAPAGCMVAHDTINIYENIMYVECSERWIPSSGTPHYTTN